MVKDSSDDDGYGWEFFDDKPPEAFVDYYGTIENVPEEHKETARTRVLRDAELASKFLNAGEKIPRRVAPEGLNAMAVATLDGFSSHILSDGEEIIDLVDDSDEFPISLPLGELGYKLFQIHTVTISYVEAASTLIIENYIRYDVEWDLESLINWASHGKRAGESLKNGKTENQLISLLEWASGSVKNLFLALLHADLVDESTYEDFDNIRARRNTFVHLLQYSPFNIFTDNHDVVTAVEECISVISALEELLATIPKHQIYNHFTRDN